MPPGGRSPTTDIDLSRLAAGYAHRPADEFALRRAARVAVAAGIGPGSAALDVGGGPGAHAATWAATGATAVVVDPSQDMNRLATTRHPGLPVVRARAESLPFRTDCATLVYFHLSIHHTRWRVALSEAARIVVPDGTVAVMTLGPDHHSASMLQRWFPRVASLDRARFPDPSEIAADLTARGAVVTVERVEQTKQRRTGDWVEAVRARFVSTLQMLDEDEIEAGLAEMTAAHPDPDAELEYTMVWDEITARF